MGAFENLPEFIPLLQHAVARQKSENGGTVEWINRFHLLTSAATRVKFGTRAPGEGAGTSLLARNQRGRLKLARRCALCLLAKPLRRRNFPAQRHSLCLELIPAPGVQRGLLEAFVADARHAYRWFACELWVR